MTTTMDIDTKQNKQRNNSDGNAMSTGAVRTSCANTSRERCGRLAHVFVSRCTIAIDRVRLEEKCARISSDKPTLSKRTEQNRRVPGDEFKPETISDTAFRLFNSRHLRPLFDSIVCFRRRRKCVRVACVVGSQFRTRTTTTTVVSLLSFVETQIVVERASYFSAISIARLIA